MKSTAIFTFPPTYIGVDLTDRYARKPRPIDVCGLWPINHGVFEVEFWTWQWSHAEPLVAGDAETEIKATRCSMLDAPQALALAGRNERACERACRAPGKTPDHFPALDRPFGGFVRSSVEFFDALHRCGIAVSPTGFVGGACEYYPGDAWPRLAGRRLPKTSTTEGRRVRRELLHTLGVRKLPELPTHDQSDACLGAILAAAADRQIRGLTVVGFGDPLATAADGGLREGPIAAPAPTTRAAG
jgi:hypothetical protein